VTVQGVAIEILKTLFVFALPLLAAPLLVWGERKVCAGMQGRIGPNRVGPFGLLQPLADVIKLVFKEDVTPTQVDRFLYKTAPIIAMVPALVLFGLLPVAQPWQVNEGIVIQFPAFDLGLGLVLFLAITSIGVYGIAFGGWASNNKYSLLGGLRSAAQMISYELVLTLSIVVVMMTVQSTSLTEVVRNQADHGWLILRQPVAALFFFIAILAENKRLPFDLPEAEAELVGGYHTEYSGMKFGMFFMGEYIAILSMSGLYATLFLGGATFPGLANDGRLLTSALSLGVFGAKVGALIFVIMWIRWTLPRFKYNRLMQMSWKGMVPLSLLNIMATALIWAATKP
jgi:NADH-quinone oxidoreductase subunit H